MKEYIKFTVEPISDTLKLTFKTYLFIHIWWWVPQLFAI